MLNRLPVEILHNLFDYFFAHELLFSFIDISEYVYSCLVSYSSYRLTQKQSLDFVYQNLHAEQIISLIVSNSFFFVYFPIEQLTRLRHLKFEKCSTKQFKRIIQHIKQLKSLNICLNRHLPNIPFTNSLIRLTIEIKSNSIFFKMNIIERISSYL